MPIRTRRRPTRLRGLRRAARRVAWEAIALARDQASALRTHEVPDPPFKLHLGCGAQIRPGWLNVDLTPEADLKLDLREPLPLPDGSASLIHAEHFFEHLENPHETQPFLAECLRLLEPGGRLSLSVPDASLALHEYARNDEAAFANAREKWHPPEESRTHMSQVNYVFRQGGEHRYAYDAETLLLALRDAGFHDAEVRPFDPELDSEARREASLRVGARKLK